MSDYNAQRNEDPDAMLDDAEIIQVADVAAAKLIAAAEVARASKQSSDRAHEDSTRLHRDNERAMAASERAESENPTRQTAVHMSPCEMARELMKSHSRLQAFVGSCVGAALVAAGYLYMRQDKTQERQTASEVAAASLTTEVRVTMAGILKSQEETKDILTKLYRVTPAGP